MRHDSCPPRRRRPTGAALAGIVLALGWTAGGKDVRRPLGAGDHGGRIAPADLRCEYRSDPLGIDTRCPRGKQRRWRSLPRTPLSMILSLSMTMPTPAAWHTSTSPPHTPHSVASCMAVTPWSRTPTSTAASASSTIDICQNSSSASRATATPKRSRTRCGKVTPKSPAASMAAHLVTTSVVVRALGIDGAAAALPCRPADRDLRRGKPACYDGPQ